MPSPAVLATATVGVGEAAVRLQEAPAATFQRIAKGQLMAHKVGSRWRIDLASLERLLAEQPREGPMTPPVRGSARRRKANPTRPAA
jgi:hypothetical protein